MHVTVSVAMVISAGSPVSVTIRVKAPAHPSPAHPKGESPASPWIIMHPESESDWSRVIIVAVPGSVIITRAVYHNPIVNIRVGVARKVTDINHFRS
jgi:hypothetical protein